MNINFKRLMTYIVVILSVMIMGVVVLLVVQGQNSKSGSPPGLVNGQLTKCPPKKNCVCSEYLDDTSYYIEPLTLSENLSLEKIKLAIGELGGVLIVEKDNYLAATFTSAIFGFVDGVS